MREFLVALNASFTSTIEKGLDWTQFLAPSSQDFPLTREQERPPMDLVDECTEEPLFEKGARAPPANSFWLGT